MEAPEELGGGQSLESRMRLRRTPVEVGADSLDLRIEILDIALSSEEIPEEQLPDLRRHEGTTFLARMTTRGELVRLDRTQEAPGVGGAGGISPVQRSVRMSGFPALPEDPVRPGDTWVDTTRVHTGVMQGMGEGTTLAVSRTTLERITRQGQTRVAELSVVSTYTFRPADSARAGERRADMSGSGSATVRLDLDAGRYLHSESSQDYTVNLGLPGADRTFSIRFHVESEAQLVEVSKPEAEGPSGDADGSGQISEGGR